MKAVPHMNSLELAPETPLEGEILFRWRRRCVSTWHNSQTFHFTIGDEPASPPAESPRWTYEKPTEPGFYLVREDLPFVFPRWVRVELDPRTNRMGACWEIHEVNAMWYGPIPEPPKLTGMPKGEDRCPSS